VPDLDTKINTVLANPIKLPVQVTTRPSYKFALAIDNFLCTVPNVYNALLRLLAVTVNSTAYAAITTGHYMQLTPPTPAVMDAADIVNLEALSVTHVKPV